MIRIRDVRIDADAVVFDKDGTLLQIDPLWIGVIREWLDAITRRAGRPELVVELRAALSIADDGRLVPNGLAHSGTMAEAVEAAAVVLHRHGVADAEQVVLAAGSGGLGFDPADVVPVGDVVGTISRLRDAGLRIAVATSDDRGPTEVHLGLLGLDGLVDLIVCADDDLAPKPSPEVFARVSTLLGVAAGRMVMVGDSEVDMATGRNGGGVACIGVRGGGGDPTGADLSIETIEEIGC